MDGAHRDGSANHDQRAGRAKDEHRRAITVDIGIWPPTPPPNPPIKKMKTGSSENACVRMR